MSSAGGSGAFQEGREIFFRGILLPTEEGSLEYSLGSLREKQRRSSKERGERVSYSGQK